MNIELIAKYYFDHTCKNVPAGFLKLKIQVLANNSKSKLRTRNIGVGLLFFANKTRNKDILHNPNNSYLENIK